MAISIRDNPGSSGAGPVSVSGYIQNPPFDSRLGSRGAVDSQGNFVMLRDSLKRGMIMTEKPTSDGRRYALNFQFNPTSFSHNAQVSADIPQAPNGAGDGMGDAWLTFAADSGQSLSFNLLFDRTFETWAPQPNKAASMQGVLVDIKTLYGLLGMYFSANVAEGQSVKSSDPVFEELTPTSPMQSVPVWVVFGPIAAYYGLIQSISVTFTHFTQNMVPVRAAVSITMAVLPRVSGTRNPVGSVRGGTTSSSSQARRLLERHDL